MGAKRSGSPESRRSKKKQNENKGGKEGGKVTGRSALPRRAPSAPRVSRGRKKEYYRQSRAGETGMATGKQEDTR